MSGANVAKKKKLTGIKKVGAIAGGAVLGVVNPFKKVGKAYQASKRVTRIASKPKVSKSVVKSIKKAVKPSRIKRQIKRYKIKTVHAAKRVQCKITRKGCFAAGTMIAVKDGFLPIEKIKAGDRVWSEDTKTGNKELKEVKKIFVREKDSIIRLSINGEVIETTDEHPFFVKDIGWIPAGELSCGDLVNLKSDDYVSIKSYDVIALEEPIKVYNFEVADNHTYYVSESKVLVHNDYNNHGNSALSKRKQHGYIIYDSMADNAKEKIQKIGISGGKLNKNGSSRRANSQVNKLNKQAGTKRYKAKVINKNLNNRREALDWEKRTAKKMINKNYRLPLHKRPR